MPPIRTKTEKNFRNSKPYAKHPRSPIPMASLPPPSWFGSVTPSELLARSPQCAAPSPRMEEIQRMLDSYLDSSPENERAEKLQRLLSPSRRPWFTWDELGLKDDNVLVLKEETVARDSGREGTGLEVNFNGAPENAEDGEENSDKAALQPVYPRCSPPPQPDPPTPAPPSSTPRTQYTHVSITVRLTWR
ncbi:hypothetical protein C8R44DRAFT_727980 [Mycena epipterygia]|nr:hypothetical protein C8R44DRAFT_727980 [Mycena epipterygia]